MDCAGRVPFLHAFSRRRAIIKSPPWSNIINEAARLIPKFLQKPPKLNVFDRFEACILKKTRGNVVETIYFYANLKIFGGEINELYKFEGV